MDTMREALEYIADSAIGSIHSLSPANGRCTLCLDVQRAAKAALATARASAPGALLEGATAQPERPKQPVAESHPEE